MDVIKLQALDLVIASLLVLLCAAISFALRLNLQRQVLWAAVRTVVQLLLVGHILRVVFAHGNGWVGTLAVAATTLITAMFILSTALRPEPWFDPRYAIALVGIVLGSVLNAASLALDGVLSGVRREKLAIEARLALGATPHQAFSTLLRESVRRGIVPSVNQMSAAGIITLPGIMTGQIIAGMDPIDAAKYQILLMFLLCGASGMAAMGAAYGAMRRLTDERGRLRLDRLSASK